MSRAAPETTSNQARAAAAGVSATVADSVDAARDAGLLYASDLVPGIRRVRSGTGFRYVASSGRVVRGADELARIAALAIPPAWKDVWICASARGHIQAVGRDARGRKQYRYHAQWRKVRDETKYGQLVAFGGALPGIRRRLKRDLARTALPREKVLATVVTLLEATRVRVGNEEYARENGSFGLTTMRDRHVEVSGRTLEFRFRGKSGKSHVVRHSDPRLARIVKACQDIPGYELFQYVDDDGHPETIDSADVNAYLREISGADFTAKLFRTWAGTVEALIALHRLGPGDTETAIKGNLVQVCKEVAAQLGNTPAICRRSYIHPAVIEAYLEGTLHATLARFPAPRASRSTGLRAEERLTLAFLKHARRSARGATSRRHSSSRRISTARNSSPRAGRTPARG